MPRRVVAPGRSCLECRRRKIKCSRSHPCKYCVQVNIDCVYPDLKQKNGDQTRDNCDVLARLEKLESASERLMQNVSQIEQRLSATSAVNEERPALEPVPTSTSHARGFWTDTVHGAAPGSPVSSHLDSLFHRINVHRQQVVSLASSHPPSDVVKLLWRSFVDNVDPILKILYMPIVHQQIEAMMKYRSVSDSSTECLLFSIYYSALVTMQESVCWRVLGEKKSALLPRYRENVDQALLNSSFTVSPDLTVLQSFVLYLICAREDPESQVGLYVGFAISSAINFGLQFDGSNIGLSPFETELRRRLWWHIYVLDAQVARDNGSQPCILETSFNTLRPENINDTSFHPNMESFAQSIDGPSDMTVSLTRLNNAITTRRVLASPRSCYQNSYVVLTSEGKDRMIDHLRETMDRQYLLDTAAIGGTTASQYLQLLPPTLKLLTFRTQTIENASLPIRLNYQKACVDVLDSAGALREQNSDTRWMWMFQVDIEWTVLSCLLDDLGTSPRGMIARAAWGTARNVYRHWEDAPDVNRDFRWKDMQRLYLRARDVFEGK